MVDRNFFFLNSNCVIKTCTIVRHCLFLHYFEQLTVKKFYFLLQLHLLSYLLVPNGGVKVKIVH